MIDRIFQILVTSDAVDAAKFAPDLQRNIDSFKTLYANADYALYDASMIAAFLEKRFSEDVCAAYHALTPFAFKADLARYCLLYHFGGVYSDLSHMHLRPIEPQPTTELQVFRDMAGHPSWATSNGLIFARKGHPALLRAIEAIVAAHKVRFYGDHPLDVTGPYLWGRVLAEGRLTEGTAFGDSRVLSRDKQGRDYSFKIMPDGEIVAFRNKFKQCSISELYEGASSHYAQIWSARQVWGEARKTVIGRVGDGLRKSGQALKKVTSS